MNNKTSDEMPTEDTPLNQTKQAKQANQQQLWLRAYVDNNDRAALDNLLALHLDAAYRAAWMFLRHEQDAVDAVQEAFINVMQAAPSFKGTASIRSWIMSIVINACHNKRRSEQRLKKREADFAHQQAFVANDPSTDAEILKELVQKETAALPELYRVPLLLHYVEEYSIDEIASTLNKSISAIRKQLQRGVAQLRKAVSGHGYQVNAHSLIALIFIELPATAPATLITSVSSMVVSTSATAAATTTASVATTSSSLASVFQSGIFFKAIVSVLVCIAAGAVYINSSSPVDKIPLASKNIGPKIPPSAVPRGRPAPLVAGWMPGVQVIGAGKFQSPYPIRSVCFSPDSKYLATGCEVREHNDGTVIIWDLSKQTEQLRISVNGIVCDMQYNSNGSVLYMLIMADRNEDDQLIAWDIKKDKELFKIPVENYYGSFDINQSEHAIVAPSGPTLDLQTSSTPNLLERMLGKKYVPSWSYFRRNVQAWDLHSGALLKTWKNVARTQKDLTIDVDWIASSNDGSKILCIDSNSGSANGAKFLKDHQVKVLDWKTQKVLYQWSLDKNEITWGDQIHWLPNDENILIQGRKYSQILNAQTGDFIEQIPGYCMLTPDEKYFISVSKDSVRYFSSTTFAKIKELPLHLGNNMIDGDFSISKNGRWLAGCFSGSQTPLLYDLQQEKLISPQTDVFRSRPLLHYTPDGRLLACDGRNSWVFNENSTSLKYIPGLIWYEAWPKNAASPDGQFLLLPSKGGATLWDIMSGNKVTTLSGHSVGYLGSTFLAPQLKYAATLGESDGKLMIHGLENGQVLSVVKGPRHDFFKNVLDIAGLFWDPKRPHLAIGDTNAGYFNEKKDLIKMGSYGEIDVAGIIDIESGKRLHKFVNDKGLPAVRVTLCASGSDLLYGSASFGTNKFETPRPATFFLWNMRDASYRRSMPNLGKNIRFNQDGSLLYGTNGIANTTNGEVIATFDEDWYCSPSYSLAARIDKNLNVKIIDIPSRYVIWQQTLLNNSSEKIIEHVEWHPAENILALTLKEQVPLLQVPLFEPIDFPETLNSEAAVSLLAKAGIQDRMQAASYFLKQRKVGIPILYGCFKHIDKTASLQQIMAVFILEHLARVGITEASTALQSIDLPSARTALSRLKRAAQVDVYKQKLSSSKSLPLSWKNRHEIKQRPASNTKEIPEKIDDF